MPQSPIRTGMDEMPMTPFGANPMEEPMLPQEQEEDITETPEFEIQEDAFNENLAEKVKDSVLTGIAASIITAIEQDKESRMEWEQSYIKGMKYLGW